MRGRIALLCATVLIAACGVADPLSPARDSAGRAVRADVGGNTVGSGFRDGVGTGHRDGGGTVGSGNRTTNGEAPSSTKQDGATMSMTDSTAVERGPGTVGSGN